MQDLLIFPFGGTAIEALDCLGKTYRCIGFISDDEDKINTQYAGVRIFSREAFSRYPDSKVLAVPGSPGSFLKRESIIHSLGVDNMRFVCVIHPSAIVSESASIGCNTFIGPGVVVTSNARIGSHVCILPNSVIHHDSVVNDYTLIGSNVTIAGNVDVGFNCYIGSGTNIINSCSIGDRVLVGMGTTVIASLESHGKYVGNPARRLIR